MDFEGLNRRQSALRELAGADDDITASINERAAAFEDLSEEDLTVAAQDLWNRALHVAHRLATTRTDNETFHKVTREKDAFEASTRCMEEGDRREEVEKTATRDVTVAGLGVITVKATHEETIRKTDDGSVLSKDKESHHVVTFKRYEADESMLVTATGKDSDENTWSLDTIAKLDDEHYSPTVGSEHDDSTPEPYEVAELAESVDSLERIARRVGIELKNQAPAAV